MSSGLDEGHDTAGLVNGADAAGGLVEHHSSFLWRGRGGVRPCGMLAAWGGHGWVSRRQRVPAPSHAHAEPWACHTRPKAGHPSHSTCGALESVLWAPTDARVSIDPDA